MLMDMDRGVVAVGGTFDRLHEGHRAILLEAFHLGDKVIIGVTSDRFVEESGKSGVAPYGKRRLSLLRFLRSQGLAAKTTIVKLEDPFGPITTEPEITCIVVTKATAENAKEANRRRALAGLRPMRICIVEMVLARDRLPISSSRIRAGEIDQHGNLLGSTIK